ncbi:MAG: alcohol dehydrogenase [Planctomycetota bacterium]
MTNPFLPDEKTRVIEGAGCLDQIGQLCLELRAQRVLVISDPGVVAAGHAPRAMEYLAQSGLVCALFDEVQADPTTEDVDRGLIAAQDLMPDVFLAVGGGSAIDVAKGIAFLYAGGGRMQDYWGKGKAKGPMLPIVAVPTTAGTGSEMQSFALITDPETHQKMACGDAGAAPCLALLDPDLTLSMPGNVVACTGLDTIGHALESAVSTAANARSRAYSFEAFRIASQALLQVFADPGNAEARAAMLRAAALAGLAIEHSMLGAAHSLANPLSAHLDMPHGLAVGTVLPVVVEFNAKDAGTAEVYGDLAIFAGLAREGVSPRKACQALVVYLRDLLGRCGFSETLPGLSKPQPGIQLLAEEAAQQWTAQFNPRPVDAKALASLLIRLMPAY